uniref:Uncharacterized protein n=1 Tax=Megaviridae environmental sample TaxID=1737588 RepID=A0A5J6VLU6_9VIRU|nr:MAG: hypothetical protein [Megaviridae environmental sample]
MIIMILLDNYLLLLYMPRASKRRKKSKGLFQLFSRKTTPPHSERAWNKTGKQFNHKAEALVYKIINKHKHTLRREGIDPKMVDYQFSKFLEPVTTQDGLDRTKIWTEKLMKNKSYKKTNKQFMKDIMTLKKKSLMMPKSTTRKYKYHHHASYRTPQRYNYNSSRRSIGRRGLNGRSLFANRYKDQSLSSQRYRRYQPRSLSSTSSTYKY